jgi:hypothetical protein
MPHVSLTCPKDGAKLVKVSAGQWKCRLCRLRMSAPEVVKNWQGVQLDQFAGGGR